MRSSPFVFILAVGVTAASRRLAAVLGRRCRCEWYRYVRTAIAFPFWPLARAATTGVAGGELVTASALLSDENSSVACH